MASHLFKVTVVQHWLPESWLDVAGQPCAQETPGAKRVKPRRVTSGTPGAKKVKKRSTKWYGRVPGHKKPFPLSANKVVAQQMLAELVRKSELRKVNIFDPFEEHCLRPLADHLNDFKADLKAKDSSPKQVRLKVGRIRRLLDGCQFVFLADLSASRVQQYLADLRQNTRSDVILDPQQEWFTRNELAAVLGVKSPTVKTLVQRHGLEASGNGKARRFPRSTVLALQNKLGRGAGIQTANYYLREIKAFCRWMVQNRRMGDDPLIHLQGGNAKLDRRHDRRALPLEELRAIIQAAQQSDKVFRGLTGPDRALLYSIACVSGFRAEELSSLPPDWFDLDGPTPTVTLPATQAKNDKTAVQPLPLDLADALRAYLAGRPKNSPLWPGTWFEKAAEMLRIDLEVAGVPYVVEGPDGPLFADFHALRHSFIALLDKSGATLKEAMQLARHSDPKLTMAVYGRAQLHDLGQAVERLPSLLTGGESANRQIAQATGTEGREADFVCTDFAQTNDSGREELRLIDPERGERSGNASGRNPLVLQEIAATCDPVIPPETNSGGWDRTSDTRLMKPLL